MHVNLAYAKARLAPIKEVTIPRLELLGILIGCRASQFVVQQLGIVDIKQILLTDSTCVLEWYQSKKELKRFVRDKIEEIRKYDVTLGYVDSEGNPADIVTRGECVKNRIEICGGKDLNGSQVVITKNKQTTIFSPLTSVCRLYKVAGVYQSPCVCPSLS